MIYLEVQAEGYPRHIGPFTDRAAAQQWATEHVGNGSWNTAALTAPGDVVKPDPEVLFADARLSLHAAAGLQTHAWLVHLNDATEILNTLEDKLFPEGETP